MKLFSNQLAKTLLIYLLSGLFLLVYAQLYAQNMDVYPLVKTAVIEGKVIESPSNAKGSQSLTTGNETLNRNTKYSIKKSNGSIGITKQASSLDISSQLPFKTVKNEISEKGKLLPATIEPTEAIFNTNNSQKAALPSTSQNIPAKQGAVSSVAGWNTINSQTFENTFPSGSWTAYANNGYSAAYWNDVNYTSYLGTWSAWCANGGLQGISPLYGSYLNNMDSWMVYGPFDLSDATAGDLSFYLKNNSETDYDNFSYMVSTNGVNFYGWKTSGSTSGWVNHTIDFTNVYTLGNTCGKSQVYIAFLFSSDASNCNYSGAFVDNVVIRKYVASQYVNLTPYQPAGWDDKIVLSTESGTNTSSPTIYDNQTIYLDWAVINSGTAPTVSSFWTYLYVDGIFQNSYLSQAGLASASYTYTTDAILGPLSAGTHTFKIVTDKFNNITESNESDNEYSCTKTITVSASANLIPYQPIGWDDKIVLSTENGTNTSASTIYDNQTIYLDWAVNNTVNSSVSQTFYTKLYIDGTLKDTYTTNGLPAGNYTFINDAVCGPLSAGSHTFKIVVDANNNVSESNESDNEYTRTKTITVRALPNLVPYQPVGWDDKIVLSTESGTNTSASIIKDNQTVYLDWAINNDNSNAITQAFNTKIYIDGILKDTYNFSNGLSENAYGRFNDATYGPFSAGEHTFKIVVDANNSITESNESDNEYTRTKTIQVIGSADINVTPVSLTINQSGETSASAPSYVLVDNSKNNPRPTSSNLQSENFQYSMGNIIPDSVVEYWKNHPSKSFVSRSMSMPSAIDWSINDSPVKNQGSCGSCWAFAVTAFIENLGIQNDLSEQAIISCSNAGSCSGGQISTALKFFQNTGVPPENCYPYIQQNGSCRNVCTSPSFKEKITTVSTMLWGLTTVENLKANLQDGPLVVCMLVPEDNTFYQYTGGVYNYNGGSIDASTQGHAVLLVGYDDNQQCFKVKNSWGSTWGESGYFRIAYDDVTDDVEFGSYAITGSGVYSEPLANHSFTIANQGMSDLTVTSISGNKSWLTTTGYPSGSFSVNPSGSQNITVSVNWALLGSSTETAIITITSNDPDESQVTVQVTAVPTQCTQTPPIVESIIQPSCDNKSGTINLKDLPASGTWTLTRMPGSITTSGTGTSTTITGLQPGTYTYTVTNSSGCTSAPSANIVINVQPLTPSAPLVGLINQPSLSSLTGSVVLNDLPATGTWILTRMPGSITITGTGTSSTITGLQPGTYTYTVTNSSGCISPASAEIIIHSFHAAPIANAGPNQSVTEGSVVTLDGSASASRSGNSLTYQWTAPPGIILNSSTLMNPSFTAPEVSIATDYTLSLVVNDGLESEADQVTITVNNSNINRHFTPIWSGNGIDHMNINLYSVKLDGVEMEAGDEVGIFDGGVCVGAGTLIRTLSAVNTLDIIVSRNDGSGNGYTPGNTISYKLYDKSKNLELINISAAYSNTNPSWTVDGKFSMGSTAFAALTCFSKTNQNIALSTGWNIVSANIRPQNLNLKELVQPLIDAGKLKKVMDETGKTIEDFGAFGGWKNNIGNLNSAKGYKINVTSAAVLSLEGAPLQLPMDISLNSGWNIISFPCTALTDGQAVMQSLINAGNLLKVMDESGKSIENFGAFGGWKNNIGNFIPGKGYKVNMIAPAILTIPANVTKSVSLVPEMMTSAHFTTVYQGNGTDHMNINLVNLSSSGILEGDEIGVFDGVHCVGSATVGIQQLIDGCISIPVSANDDSGPELNGFIEGNPVRIQIYRNNQDFAINLQMQNNSKGNFIKGTSLFAIASIGSISEIREVVKAISVKCYPNPFTEQLNIEISQPEKESLKVEIYDLTGKLIRYIYDGIPGKNVRMVWDGKNNKGLKMTPGTYILKVNNTIEKIILK